MKVEIYSDIACPWCYIGERRFAKALAAFPKAEQVEVVFRPFQLDPTLPHTPAPLREQLKSKFGERTDAMLRQTAATARQEGLAFDWDAAQAVNTLAAHRLLRFAEQASGAEVQRKLADKLFEAYFSKGENVGDAEVLARLASEVGLDRDRVADYLASDEGTREVQDEIERAQRIGVQAVPTFVFDGEYALQGAQPPAAFLEMMAELYQPEPADADACADGSCAV